MPYSNNIPPQNSGMPYPTINIPPQNNGIPYTANIPPQNTNIPYTSANAPLPFYFDHTAEFDPKDIEDNKVVAMLVYLMDVVGVVVASLVCTGNSPYVSFHIRQSLKITVLEVLSALCITLLFWTIIAPVIGGIFMLVLNVVKFICFVRVGKNLAIEPPVVRDVKFLK